ncbi:MAG: transporter, partial [Acidobacteriota bacterium]|nr:transporter [Acidobacteriota bacterium]
MRNRLLLPAAGLLIVVGCNVAGCNVGPKYARPRIPAPTAYRGPDEKAAADRESLGDRQWSAVFRQPELQDLIRAALADNFDLRIAAEHILEQEAQVRIARAQQFPTISA